MGRASRERERRERGAWRDNCLGETTDGERRHRECGGSIRRRFCRNPSVLWCGRCTRKGRRRERSRPDMFVCARPPLYFPHVGLFVLGHIHKCLRVLLHIISAPAYGSVHKCRCWWRRETSAGRTGSPRCALRFGKSLSRAFTGQVSAYTQQFLKSADRSITAISPSADQTQYTSIIHSHDRQTDRQAVA